jgi:hypothetical protein
LVRLKRSFDCEEWTSPYRLHITHSRSDNPARPVPWRVAGPPGLTLRRSRILVVARPLIAPRDQHANSHLYCATGGFRDAGRIHSRYTPGRRRLSCQLKSSRYFGSELKEAPLNLSSGASMCNAPAIPLRKLAKNKPALSSQRCGASGDPEMRSTSIIQFGREPGQAFGTAGR